MQNKDCNFFKDQIYSYVSDGLSDAETEELLAHIESCPECARELNILNSIISATASIPQIEVPDGLKASVFEKLEASTQSTAPKRYKFKRFASLALPVAACIALSIGVFSGGLYDKFVASDDIISSGDVNPAPIQANTEHADATENTKPADTSTNAVPDTVTPKKSTPQPKTEQRDKSAVSSQSDSAVENSAPASDDIAVVSESAQTENSLADTPSVASFNTPRERFIAKQPIADVDDAEQASNDSIAVASSGAAKMESAVPASCIVITENISAFSDEFDVTAEDGELYFKLDADKWQDFLSFAENIGAELNADYSAENNGYVSITICMP